MVNKVSIIIPTNRTTLSVIDNIKSVYKSMLKYSGEKELILCIDREVSSDDFLLQIFRRKKLIKFIENKKSIGSAYIRNLGIKSASGDILIFTDDDSMVPLDWVNSLSKEVLAYGLCAGNLVSKDNRNTISKLEQYIDQCRIHSIDSLGNYKFISFPNFAIKKDLLPKIPFSIDIENTTEDIDLACNLRLKGVKINFNKDIIVGTTYPTKLKDAINRKLKHSKGISFLRSKYGKAKWRNLEIESTGGLFLKWIGISLSAPFPFVHRIEFLVMNMSYCIGLLFYPLLFSLRRKV